MNVAWLISILFCITAVCQARMINRFGRKVAYSEQLVAKEIDDIIAQAKEKIDMLILQAKNSLDTSSDDVNIREIKSRVDDAKYEVINQLSSAILHPDTSKGHREKILGDERDDED